MTSCKVQSCVNHTGLKGESLYFPQDFFSFPKNRKVAERWLELCNCKLKCPIQDYEFTNKDVVCSIHFASDAFIELDSETQLEDGVMKHSPQLKPDAIPTLHLPLRKEESAISKLTKVAPSEEEESVITKQNKAAPLKKKKSAILKSTTSAPACVIGGCTSFNSNGCVHYHTIPYNRHTVRDRWIEFIQSTRDNFEPSGLTRKSLRKYHVCSWHFTPDQYDTSSTNMYKFKIRLKYPKLKPDSVPCLEDATNPFPDEFFVNQQIHVAPPRPQPPVRPAAYLTTLMLKMQAIRETEKTLPPAKVSDVSGYSSVTLVKSASGMMPSMPANLDVMNTVASSTVGAQSQQTLAHSVAGSLDTGTPNSVMPPILMAQLERGSTKLGEMTTSASSYQSVRTSTTSLTNASAMGASNACPAVVSPVEFTNSTDLADLTNSASSSPAMTKPEVATNFLDTADSLTPSSEMDHSEEPAITTFSPVFIQPELQTITTSANSVEISESPTFSPVFIQPELSVITTSAKVLDVTNSSTSSPAMAQPELTIGTPSANLSNVSDSSTLAPAMAQPELATVTLSANLSNVSASSTLSPAMAQPELTTVTPSVNLSNVSDSSTLSPAMAQPELTTVTLSANLSNLMSDSSTLSPAMVQPKVSTVTPSANLLTVHDSSTSAFVIMQPELTMVTASADLLNSSDSSTSSPKASQTELTSVSPSANLSNVSSSTLTSVITKSTMKNASNLLGATDSSTSSTVVTQPELSSANLLDVNNCLTSSPAVTQIELKPSCTTTSANLLDMADFSASSPDHEIAQPESPVITTSPNLLNISDTSILSSIITQPELSNITTKTNLMDTTNHLTSSAVMSQSEETATTNLASLNTTNFVTFPSVMAQSERTSANTLNKNTSVSSPYETNIINETSTTMALTSVPEATSATPRPAMSSMSVQACAANSIHAELYMQPETGPFIGPPAKSKRIASWGTKSEVGTLTFNIGLLNCFNGSQLAKMKHVHSLRVPDVKFIGKMQLV